MSVLSSEGCIVGGATVLTQLDGNLKTHLRYRIVRSLYPNDANGDGTLHVPL